MPFKSEKQKKFMYANKPELAKKWSKKYSKGKTVTAKHKGKSKKWVFSIPMLVIALGMDGI